MLALERRNLILEKLQEEKRVVVSDLSRQFQVSEETIRRDLDKMHQDGLVVKSYGGAVFNEDTNIDMPFNIRKKHNVSGKQKIARILEGLIEDGEHIFLDASTTAVFIAKAIKKKERMTVITNSIEILIELSDVSGWDIVSPGGSLKEGCLALVGPRTVKGLGEYNVEKTIFSCKGLDIKRGITDSHEEFSKAKQTMLNASEVNILAVDHSKFDKRSFSKIGNISDVDIIVTDEMPDAGWLTYFEQQGVRCIYPEDS